MPSKMAGSQASSTSPDPSSATRLQRNLAEKQRRDKLNGYITELANIVPMVSLATKRLDKTSILRLSAAHLRIYQSSLHGRKRRTSKNSFKWRPNFLNAGFLQEVLEAVDGFLLVTISSGKIIYISQTVEHFLGHQHIEMIGHSIFSFIHPADCDIVKGQLQKLTVASLHKKGGSSARCSFSCRLRERNQPRSEVMTYQLVHIVGHMTDSEDSENIDEEKDEAGVSPSNFLFKAFVQVVHSSPYNDLPCVVEDEYVTRHRLDGTIIFADHRISTITGHLPHEVLGINAYRYIMDADIPVALFAHRLMFSSSEGTGLVVYRLKTRDHDSVILRSTGYIQYEYPSQRDHFVCVNKVLSGEEGEHELRKFVECFTPHISGSSVTSLYESIKSIEISGISHKNDTDDKAKVETNGNIVPILEDQAPTSKSLKISESVLVIKSEPNDHTLRSDGSLQDIATSDNHIQSSDSNVSSSDTFNSDCSQPQISFDAYSQHLSVKDRLSPDSDSTGQTYLCQSPLTDSSASNSFQSENTVAFSPQEAHNGCNSETSLLTNDSASSLPPVSVGVSPQQVSNTYSSTQGPSEKNQSMLEPDVTVVFTGVASSTAQSSCFLQQSHLPPTNLWCASPLEQRVNAQNCSQGLVSARYSEEFKTHDPHFAGWKKGNGMMVEQPVYLYTSGEGNFQNENKEKSVSSSQGLTSSEEPMDDQPTDNEHI